MYVAWINGKASETTQGECGSVASLSLVCGKAVRQGWSKQPNERSLDKRIKALLQGTAAHIAVSRWRGCTRVADVVVCTLVVHSYRDKLWRSPVTDVADNRDNR